MSARLRTSLKSYKYEKFVFETFDVLGPQRVASAKAPLNKIRCSRRKQASRSCIILGLAITSIYIALTKGIPLILVIVGMKTDNFQMVSTGLESIQFGHTDKTVIASFLLLFAVTSLILRFPEVRDTIIELFKSIAPNMPVNK